MWGIKLPPLIIIHGASCFRYHNNEIRARPGTNETSLGAVVRTAAVGGRACHSYGLTVGALPGGCMRLAGEPYFPYVILRLLTAGLLELGPLRLTFWRQARKFPSLYRTLTTGESEGRDGY